MAAITFIGNTAWEAVEDPVWSVDFFGVDHCTILYRGSRLLKAAFEAQLEKDKFKALTGFPGVKLVSWGGTPITPNFPGIQLTFLGFRSGVVPPLRITDSMVTQTASGSGVDTATGRNVSGNFVYRAARTSYVWFDTKQPPKDCPYNKVTDTRDPLTNIISYSIQDSDTLQPINSVPFSAFVAVFNKLIRRQFVSDYQREQLIPNLLWQCSASVDYQVVQ